jgi:CarD family transcriptional regulator
MASKKPAVKVRSAASKAPAKKAPAPKAPAPNKAPAPKAAASAKKAQAAKASAPKKALAAKASAPKKAQASKAASAPKKAPPPKPVSVPKAAPPAPKAAPPAPKAAPPDPKAQVPVPKPLSKFAVGDKVVHPQHGAATIKKKLRQEFAGTKRDYYVLDIATESLTVMVPVDRIDELVRSVISRTAAKNVLASLRNQPEEAGANWSRWYKVLTEKMYSGDIMQVAEVVRDLTHAQQHKGISPALKRMLSKARLTLTSELSFSLAVDDEEATKRLDRALPQVEAPVA